MRAEHDARRAYGTNNEFPLSAAGSRRGPEYENKPKTNQTEGTVVMYYIDDSLYPKNMQPLIITAAPESRGGFQ
jgi:hypothetical protein